MMGAEPSLIGTRLAKKFLIESLLGDGAMGKVYRARHIDLDQTVALKVLRRELASQASFLARFQREARTTFQIVHPNIVRVIDFGIDPSNVTYLAMEFVEGSDLAAVILHETPVATERIVHLMRQALAGIAAAHAVGIVHRDLKPENIMVTHGTDDEGNPTEIAKVCDFGIAKLLADDASQRVLDEQPANGRRKLTERGLLVGTPEYMAPEYARGDKIDGRADVYAMGVVLYELLTGRLPFTAISPTAMLLQHVNEVPPAPSSIARVHPRLEEICLRALEKDPAQRFQTARAMRAALGGVIGARGSIVDGDEAAWVDPPPLDTLMPLPGSEPARGKTGPSSPPRQVDTLPAPASVEAPVIAPSPPAPALAAPAPPTPAPTMSRGGLVAGFLGLILASVGVALIVTSRPPAAATAAPPSAASPPATSVQNTPNGANTANAANAASEATNEPSHAAVTATASAITASASARPLPSAPPHPAVGAPRAIASVSSAQAGAAPSATPAPIPDPAPPPTPIATPVAVAPTPPPSPPPAVAPAAPPPAPAAVDPSHGHVSIAGVANEDRVQKRNVQAAMGRILPALTACYQTDLRTSSIAKAGSATLHVETDNAGVVVRSHAGVPFAPAIAACVERAAKGITIAGVDTGEAEADVTFAFVLSP